LRIGERWQALGEHRLDNGLHLCLIKTGGGLWTSRLPLPGPSDASSVI